MSARRSAIRGERVLASLKAGADATGCEFEHRFTGRDYADIRKTWLTLSYNYP